MRVCVFLRVCVCVRVRVCVRTQYEVKMPLGSHVLRDLAPGREYCVSVRIWAPLAQRYSVYSQPQCTSTTSTGVRAKGTHKPCVCVWCVVIFYCGLCITYLFDVRALSMVEPCL